MSHPTSCSHSPFPRAIVWLPLCLVAAACGGGRKNHNQPGELDDGGRPSTTQPGEPDGDGRPTVSGTAVAVSLAPAQQAEVQRLQAALADTAGITAEQLLAKRAPAFLDRVGFDATKSLNFDKLQASSFKLGDAEQALLARNGFVVTDKKRFPHFAYGYKAIYAEDLPVFVSADSILRAVHQSYDDILAQLERVSLSGEMKGLIDDMRTALPRLGDVDDRTRQDLDLFLAVAASLARETAVAPVAGANAADVKRFLTQATSATGTEELELFGVQRIIDWSQFKPRGHYAGDQQLEPYFRALMWLGRIDFPMLQTPKLGKPPVLVRRSVQAAFALRALLGDAGLARWKRIDAVIRGFVGEPDSMAPPQVDGMRAALGLTGFSLAGVTDEKLAGAIVAGAYGQQKILSQIVLLPWHEGTWPLDATFLFFGQRYVVDSHVFSNVVYDRVNVPGAPYRMMPDPLDVAYAALGNDQAAGLLADGLVKHKYAPALEGIRTLVDAHPASFWGANLYNRWLSALRTLSPTADVGQVQAGLPAAARTAAWGKRLLSAQLSSWAELRRDTILYAKQSYTSGVACEYPDAYVEPYPAFFAAIEAFAAQGLAISADLPVAANMQAAAQRVRDYFAGLQETAKILREMADHQRTGQPHTAASLAFINQAVDVQQAGCAASQTVMSGWYSQLYFNRFEATEFKPAVADVHTQPTDEAGNLVGHVLHVGSGWPRTMVVTVETCEGPRAYVGLASSFHQEVTKDFVRLVDSEWAQRFMQNQAPPDPTWLTDVIAR